MPPPFIPLLLITAAILANATVASAESGSRQADSELAGSKPNIIVIMPDDSSYGNYSCLGNPIIKTPNIDALKKESLLLTRYHSSARCSPSRAKLLSGRHEFLGGVTHTIQGCERLSLDTITLPQALKTAGYATGMFGKWHNGNEGPYRPENRGFDECWMYEKGSRMKATISHNGKPQRMDGTYPTDLFFEKATEWMDVQRQAKKPFFVYLPPKSPHGPYKEDSSDIPNEEYQKFLGSHPEMKVQIAKIYWEVENIDKRIGEMIQQLEEWGIRARRTGEEVDPASRTNGRHEGCGTTAGAGWSCTDSAQQAESADTGPGYSVRVRESTMITEQNDRTSKCTVRRAAARDLWRSQKEYRIMKNHDTIIIALLSILSLMPSQATEPAPFPIWKPGAMLAKAEDLPEIRNVDFHVIKKWSKKSDGYTFLHGVGLAQHKGKLYASFGHNKGAENTVSEEAQYRVSEDGGRTWGSLKVMDAGDEPDLAVSHGVFHLHEGALWAFHGAYFGHGSPKEVHEKMKRIHTRAYCLDEKTGKWEKHGVVVENGFWPMNQPVKMADGNWIMPGFVAGSTRAIFPAAVAISHGNDLTKWDLVKIPVAKNVKAMWGESGIFVDGKTIFNIARIKGGTVALVAKSENFGRDWSPSSASNLPMTTSKPAAGILSTGQR